METKSFIANGKKFQFTVKIEFFKKVSIDAWSVYELMSKFYMADYLHNPIGPAIIHLDTGHQEFWLNGKQVPEEVASKMRHTISFNNDLMDMLNS